MLPLEEKMSFASSLFATMFVTSCHIDVCDAEFISLVIRDASDFVLGVFGKLSMRRGARASFHDIWTCPAKVLEY
jgi:hypothetical protein